MEKHTYYDEPKREHLRLGDYISIRDGYVLVMGRVSRITPQMLHLMIYNYDIIQPELVITHQECRDSIELGEVTIYHFEAERQMRRYVEELTDAHTRAVFEKLNKQRAMWSNLYEVGIGMANFMEATHQWVLELNLYENYPMCNIITLCRMFIAGEE